MKIVDLTMPLSDGMQVYPGDPDVKIELLHTYDKNGWLLRRITMGTHTGTHVDAFSHMDEQGETLDDIPLERFFGRARLVRPDRPLPSAVGLIFGEDAGMELLDRILALRPPFVAGGISMELECALLNNKIVTYTNLINLDRLPPDREFIFLGLPLRIRHGDGSPVRAVAIIDGLPF